MHVRKEQLSLLGSISLLDHEEQSFLAYLDASESALHSPCKWVSDTDLKGSFRVEVGELVSLYGTHPNLFGSLNDPVLTELEHLAKKSN